MPRHRSVLFSTKPSRCPNLIAQISSWMLWCFKNTINIATLNLSPICLLHPSGLNTSRPEGMDLKCGVFWEGYMQKQWHFSEHTLINFRTKSWCWINTTYCCISKENVICVFRETVATYLHSEPGPQHVSCSFHNFSSVCQSFLLPVPFSFQR